MWRLKKGTRIITTGPTISRTGRIGVIKGYGLSDMKKHNNECYWIKVDGLSTIFKLSISFLEKIQPPQLNQRREG